MPCASRPPAMFRRHSARVARSSAQGNDAASWCRSPPDRGVGRRSETPMLRNQRRTKFARRPPCQMTARQRRGPCGRSARVARRGRPLVDRPPRAKSLTPSSGGLTRPHGVSFPARCDRPATCEGSDTTDAATSCQMAPCATLCRPLLAGAPSRRRVAPGGTPSSRTAASRGVTAQVGTPPPPTHTHPTPSAKRRACRLCIFGGSAGSREGRWRGRGH